MVFRNDRVVGSFNHDNFVRSMPEKKLPIAADGCPLDATLTALIRLRVVVPASAQVPLGFNSGISNWRTIDLSYNYNFNLGDTQAVFTLGGKNVFDKEAPRVYDAANFSYDPKHHDPRGRMLFARVKFAL